MSARARAYVLFVCCRFYTCYAKRLKTASLEKAKPLIPYNIFIVFTERRGHFRKGAGGGGGGGGQPQ